MKFRYSYIPIVLSVFVLSPAGADDAAFPYDDFPAFSQPDAACDWPATSSETATVDSIEGDVSARHQDGDWCDAVLGLKVSPSDELHTGPESSTRVTFSDGSFLIVHQLTETAIGDLSGAVTRPTVRVLLKMGEVAAKVNHEVDLPADFAIRTPDATASVRGTDFVVVADPQDGTTIRVDQGEVLVEPANKGLQAFVVPEHKFASVARDSVNRGNAPIP
jgi:hypothetical protein